MSAISKRHIAVGAKKVFVQIMGKGPALALFHASPHNSNMLLPLAQKLADHYTVICVDTPGYGQSEGFEKAPEDIEVYVDVFHQLFQNMGISKLALYGSATGSQIAIRYGLKYPEMLTHIFLDNAAHFDDDLRNEILKHYFPDLTPDMEGTHLTRLWDIVTHMFKYFPWFAKSAEYAVNKPKLPISVLHGVAMDYLIAGEGYDHAYKVAFMHERGEYVQQLQVDTTIFRWTGSIVLLYIDRLVNHELPSNVSVVSLDANPQARTEGMVGKMIEKSAEHLPYELPEGIGEAYSQNRDLPHITLPEPSEDGSYLYEAWLLIRGKFPDAPPTKIQQLLVNGYAEQTN